MGIKKHYATLAMMAAIAAASGNNELDVPASVSFQKSGPRKCDTKKCKSCRHFLYRTYKGRCTKNGSIVDPWNMACERYIKRKK